MRSREYNSWKAMKTRCTNKNHKQYADYGGRGITVCRRWMKSFTAFYNDMGDCLVGYTIDRRDNTKGYSASNCLWSSRKTQNNNKRNNRNITFNGRTQTLAAWAEELSLDRITLKNRLDRLGWSIAKTLTTPPRTMRGVNC